MLDLEKIFKCAKVEADWLRYYGHEVSRMNEDFSDVNFYDRIESIGYTKRVIPLPNRCSMLNITSDKPVLNCEVSELEICHKQRSHDKNIYTALEYLIGKEIFKDQLIKIIRGEL